MNLIKTAEERLPENYGESQFLKALNEEVSELRQAYEDIKSAIEEQKNKPSKEELHKKVRDAIEEASNSLYVCIRTWSAWDIGTMRESDFYAVLDCDDVLDNLTNAAISAISLQPQVSK